MVPHPIIFSEGINPPPVEKRERNLFLRRDVRELEWLRGQTWRAEGAGHSFLIIFLGDLTSVFRKGR
jgi:hypothetical protein